MSDYPEHEKLRKVSDDSNTIGSFLDYGLPELGLTLYEKIERDCECTSCKRRGGRTEGMHTPEEAETAKANKGKVVITEWVPCSRRIEVILAEHYGIDLDKIATEKDDMLDAMRAMNA